MPFAFIQESVSMLSGVLRPPIAIYELCLHLLQYVMSYRKSNKRTTGFNKVYKSAGENAKEIINPDYTYQ